MYSFFLLYGIDTNLKNIARKVNGYQIPEVAMKILIIIIEAFSSLDNTIVKKSFQMVFFGNRGIALDR